jgi:hypothetical protein
MKPSTRILGFTIGFLVIVNLQFPPGLARGVRVLDYLGAITWSVLIFQLLRHRRLPRRPALRGLLLLGMIFPWIAISLVAGRTLVEPIRWILALGCVAAILYSLRSPARPYVLKGIIWGTVVQLAVLGIQFAGFFDLTVSLGFAPPDIDVANNALSRWRPPGMYGTNGTPAVALLSVPAALALVDEGHARGRWVAFAVALSLATSTVTLTRSTMVALVAILALWTLFKTNNTKRVAAAMLAAVLAISALVAIGPPGGWERWETASLSSKNAQVRIESTVASAYLAIEHPFGLGRDTYLRYLQDASGSSATHNAFTYLALAAHLPLAVCVVVFLLGRATTVLYRRDFEAWLALTLLSVAIWEEHYRNSVFVIMSVYIVVSGMYQKN